MISARELRPFNQVTHNGRIGRVTTIYADPKGDQFSELQIGYNSVFINEVEGIRIEEVHLQEIAGPDLSSQETEHTKVFRFECGPFDCIILKPEGRIKLMNTNLHQLEIVYWHHLQNIYHSLTGNEIYLKDNFFIH